MYRSLLYRNFLSEKDNAIALMKPAWQAQSRDGEGEKKSPSLSSPYPSLSSRTPTDVQSTTP